MIKRYKEFSINEAVASNMFTEFYGNFKRSFRKMTTDLIQKYPKDQQNNNRYYQRNTNHPFNWYDAPSSIRNDYNSYKQGEGIIQKFIRDLQNIRINPATWDNSDIQVLDKNLGDNVSRLSRRPYNQADRYSYLAFKRMDDKLVPFAAWTKADNLSGNRGVRSRKDALAMCDVFWIIDNTKYGTTDEVEILKRDRESSRKGMDFGVHDDETMNHRRKQSHDQRFHKKQMSNRDKYSSIASKNRGRYAEEIVKGKSYDDFWANFQKLFTLVSEEDVANIKKYSMNDFSDNIFNNNNNSFPTELFKPIQNWFYSRGGNKHQVLVQLVNQFTQSYRKMTNQDDPNAYRGYNTRKDNNEESLKFFANLSVVLKDLLDHQMSLTHEPEDYIWLGADNSDDYGI